MLGTKGNSLCSMNPQRERPGERSWPKVNREGRTEAEQSQSSESGSAGIHESIRDGDACGGEDQGRAEPANRGAVSVAVAREAVIPLRCHGELPVRAGGVFAVGVRSRRLVGHQIGECKATHWSERY